LLPHSGSGRDGRPL